MNPVASPVHTLDLPETSRTSISGRGGVSLFRSTASVGFATALSKLAGAAKTALITLFFRPGSGLDSYLLAFLFISFLVDIVFGAVNPVLVPVLIEADEKGREKRLGLYAAALYRSMLASIVLAAALGMAACAAHELRLFAEPADRTLFIRMLLIMLPILPLTALTTVWRSVLNADLRVGAASLSYILTPVTAALLLVLAHSRGVVVLAAGSSFGLLAEAIFLAAVLQQAGTPVFPRRSEFPAPPDLPGKQFGAVVAGNLVSKGAIAVDQAFAALSGVGGLSILNLGTRLTMVVLAIGPGALGTAILPRFSRLVATGTTHLARGSLIRTLAAAFATMAALSCILVWLSEPIVRLAFSHGALNSGDLYRVTQAQRWSLVQAPFSVGLAILIPFVASLKANHSVLPVWFAALGAHAVFDFLVVKSYGVAGILCVSAGIEAAVLFATLFIVFRKLRHPDLNQIPV